MEGDMSAEVGERMGRRRAFHRLLVIESLLAMAATLASPFVSIYLFRSDVGYVDIAIFYGLAFGLTVLLCSLFSYHPVTNARRSISMAMCVQTGFYIGLLVLPLELVFLICPVLFATYIVWFWVPFNFLFIDLTTRSDRSTTVGITFVLFPIISLFTPMLGGYIITHLGYLHLFLLTGTLLGINAFLPWAFLKGERGIVRERAVISIRGFGLRLGAGLTLQGMQDGIFFFAIPLSSLFFTGGEFKVGMVLSLFALGGAIGALIFARLSDRSGNRVTYIRTGALLALPLFLLVGALPNLLMFVMCMGMAYLALHLSWIFLMTLAVDRMEGHGPTALLSREMLLNLGRALGTLVIAFIWLVRPELMYAFIIMAITIGASAITK